MKKLGSTKGTLQLSKETLRVLTTQDLENVAGGACYYICQLK